VSEETLKVARANAGGGARGGQPEAVVYWRGVRLGLADIDEAGERLRVELRHGPFEVGGKIGEGGGSESPGAKEQGKKKDEHCAWCPFRTCRRRRGRRARPRRRAVPWAV
jgi:hypothetical protein